MDPGDCWTHDVLFIQCQGSQLGWELPFSIIFLSVGIQDLCPKFNPIVKFIILLLQESFKGCIKNIGLQVGRIGVFEVIVMLYFTGVELALGLALALSVAAMQVFVALLPQCVDGVPNFVGSW